MDWPPFYRTAMGREYYDKTIPDLVRQIEKLNEILARLVERLPEKKTEE